MCTYMVPNVILVKTHFPICPILIGQLLSDVSDVYNEFGCIRHSVLGSHAPLFVSYTGSTVLAATVATTTVATTTYSSSSTAIILHYKKLYNHSALEYLS